MNHGNFAMQYKSHSSLQLAIQASPFKCTKYNKCKGQVTLEFQFYKYQHYHIF